MKVHVSAEVAVYTYVYACYSLIETYLLLHINNSS